MSKQELDNPVWFSLSETHQNLAIDYQDAKFYHPDYCPFGGFINPNTIAQSIDLYSNLIPNFYIVGDKPSINSGIVLIKNLVCDQMVLDSAIQIETTEQITDIQTVQQKNDLFQLVNLVQPGYFRNKTSDLGNYYGIYKNNELIAVTGERMQMTHYTEVSAVVTHPHHTGKGYAKQLVAHTANKIFERNKTPFLHVAETNTRAIQVYENLGFVLRRKISFWNFEKKKNENFTLIKIFILS